MKSSRLRYWTLTLCLNGSVLVASLTGISCSHFGKPATVESCIAKRDVLCLGTVVKQSGTVDRLVNGRDTALALCTQSGFVGGVEYLLSQRADPNLGDRSTGITPLYDAVAPCTMLLIGHGADVNRRDSNGWTALHWACHYSDIVLCTALLEKGADPNARNHEGETPLLRACITRHPNRKLIKILISYGGNTAIKDARGKSPASVMLHRFG